MKSVSEAGAAATSGHEREEAGKRIARRVLTTCWSSLLSQLLTTVAPYLQKPAGMAGKSALYGFLGGNASRKGGGGTGFGGKSPGMQFNRHFLSRNLSIVMLEVLRHVEK